MEKVNYEECLEYFNSCKMKGCAFGYVAVRNPEEWRWMHFSMPFNKLYFILEGSITVELLGNDGIIETVYSMSPGNVCLLPCGNMYNLYTDTGFAKYFMHINLPMLDGYDLFYGIRQVLSCPFPMEQWQQIPLRTDMDIWNCVMYGKSIAYHALGKLLEQYSSSIFQKRFYAVSQYPAELLSVIGYIQNTLSAQLTVTDAAQYSRISYPAMVQLFKKHLGITPKQFISDRLHEKACEMLFHTEKSVKEIATELRFNTVYAFSNFFKNRCGYAPSRYRSMFKQL